MSTSDDPDRRRQPDSQPPEGPPRGPYGQPIQGPPQGPYGPPPQGPYAQGPFGGSLPPPPSGPMGPGDGWPPPPPTGGGLGTAALVLGIAGLVLLPVCGIGALVAVPGLIVGIVATVKRSNRRRAVIGLALSIATLVLAVLFAVLFSNWLRDTGLRECFDPVLYPDQESMQHCVESRLGGAKD
ncbi:DUF4190 domain-containing protein [Sphaerimonospora cavernae]|uniref:DUF4190 domain-containing protein n=1 Tax=Sphaerimonospora cavernae TaxID=1740611 RepID=A0ABV6U1Y8_9ACTN